MSEGNETNNILSDFINRADLSDWGAIASILALAIALIGFFITIRKVSRSEKAVKQVRDELRKIDTISDFSSAITTMVEIKRLHREKAWAILPDRYAELRESLISIKELNPTISDGKKKIIQSAIQNFRGLEEKIETCLYQKKDPEDVDKFNHLISRHIDKLQRILIEFKNQRR